jgi:HK97 family phage major capsid protein
MKSHIKSLSLPLAAMLAARPAALIGSVRMEGDVSALLKEVKQTLEKVESDVKSTAESALREAKQAGAVSAETKANADKLLQSQTLMQNAFDKLQAKVEQLDSDNRDLEQRVAQRRGGGAEPVLSAGRQFVADKGVKAFLEGGARGTVKHAITSASNSGGALIRPDRDPEIAGMARRQMTIRQLLSVGQTSSNSVEYARQTTRTINARPVTEGAQKPESALAWTLETAPVRTIAHWIPVSRQAIDDAAMLAGEIDNELTYGLDLVEELQILKGDGTGQNLEGLVTAATAYSPAFTLSGSTMIDDLRLAILQASLSEYMADGIVLNPIDWARIELMKDGEQRYIFANVIQMAGPQLWGKPVVATNAMDEDEFLVGAFRMAATIWDRMETEFLLSSEDRDNFIKNMLTARAEKRLALGIKRPAALVAGDFGNVT